MDLIDEIVDIRQFLVGNINFFERDAGFETEHVLKRRGGAGQGLRRGRVGWKGRGGARGKDDNRGGMY